MLALLVVALLAAALAIYGLGAGGSFYFHNVHTPLRPAPDAPYYRESLLHVGLAHLLGLGASILAFRLFVLAGFWLAMAWLAGVVRRRLSLADTALVLLVLTFHPAAMIVHAWTCHPDAFTVLLAALLLFSRRPPLVAVVAALGAWNHAAMWLVICAQTVLLRFSFAEPRWRAHAVAIITGAAVGTAGCKLALSLAGVNIVDDRLALAARHGPGVLLHHFTDVGWPVVYTLHFAHLLWLPLLLVVLPRRAALGVLAAQLLALAAAFFTEDTTRVFAVLGWSSLVFGLVHALAQPTTRLTLGLRRLVGLALVVTIAAPKIFAWKGELHDTAHAQQHLHALLFGADRPPGKTP